jgi:hypothetical protein
MVLYDTIVCVPVQTGKTSEQLGFSGLQSGFEQDLPNVNLLPYCCENPRLCMIHCFFVYLKMLFPMHFFYIFECYDAFCSMNLKGCGKYRLRPI